MASEHDLAEQLLRRAKEDEAAAEAMLAIDEVADGARNGAYLAGRPLRSGGRKSRSSRARISPNLNPPMCKGPIPELLAGDRADRSDERSDARGGARIGTRGR